MSHGHILQDVLLIFAVSIGVVFLFQKLRLPSIAGFLVVGTLVGPYGLNIVSDRSQIQVLAEIGVILLLFTIGIEFSLARFKASPNLFLIGGPLQIAWVLVLVAMAGVALGLPARQAIFWGLLLSLSSTAIVLKALADRGESDTLHGRSTIGILIFQDLAVVPMVLLTPLLGSQQSQEAGHILITLAQSAAVVGITIVAARVLVPKFLEHIAHTGSRELFLLTIIVLGLGTAWLTSLAGLSLAIGAFIAGLMISESEYSHQALAEVLPFRDSFNSLFFVSIGMLMDLRIIIEQPILIILLTTAVLIGKFLTATGAVLATGAPIRSGILSGIALAQVGEFAFILALEGQRVDLLSQDSYNVFLAVSVLTMIITPFLIQWGPQMARRTEAFQRLHQWWPKRLTTLQDSGHVKIKDHVIIVGYGLNGRNLARVLGEVEIPFIVIDMRAELVQKGGESGIPIMYGDATIPTVLRKVHIEDARVLVIATSDPYGARRMVQLSRGLNPALHIMVRTRYLKELDELHDLGANEVVPEEFETSIEIFALVLGAYKVPQDVILEKAEKIRREGYALLRRGELPELAHHLRGGTLTDVEVDTCLVNSDSPALGKTLAEISLRHRTRVSVIGLTRDGMTQSNPSENSTLQVGDILVLLGSREQIRRALALLTDTKPD